VHDGKLIVGYEGNTEGVFFNMVGVVEGLELCADADMGLAVWRGFRSEVISAISLTTQILLKVHPRLEREMDSFTKDAIGFLSRSLDEHSDKGTQLHPEYLRRSCLAVDTFPS
jgi:hypothetical protein